MCHRGYTIPPARREAEQQGARGETLAPDRKRISGSPLAKQAKTRLTELEKTC